MLVKSCFSACLFFVVFQGNAQIILGPETEQLVKSPFAVTDKGWVDRGSLSINTTQTYLSNWAAGGNSAINLSGLATYSFFYRDEKHNWDNIINLAYGRSVIDIREPSIKTDDKIDITSKYGRRATPGWSYTGMLNIKSQFAPGYIAGMRGLPDVSRGKISDWLSPAYFTLAAGMDYIKERKFTCFLSPFTCKGTVVKNQILANAGQFGVDPAEYNSEGLMIRPGKNIRIEYGSYVRMGFSQSWKDKYRLDSKAELFSSYLNNPGNIDFNIESVLACKFNKYLACSMILQMIYDDDIILVKSPAYTDNNGTFYPEKKGPGLQFKEVVAIGFQYSL